MYRKLIAAISCFLILPAWAATINGDFGNTQNNLTILKSAQGVTTVQGNFLNRKYDYQIETLGTNLHLVGIIDGVSRDLDFAENNSIINVNDRLNTLNLVFDNRDFGAFVTGKYNNNSATIRIDRSDWRTNVTGFYAKNLNDLRIIKNDDGFQFHGYVNGYWTDLIFVTTGKKIVFEGRLMNQMVKYSVDNEMIDLDDLLELIIFGFYIPGTNLF